MPGRSGEARPLALTMGDPAGIGPEITLKAWLVRRDSALPPFFALADIDVLARTADRLRLDVPLVETDPAAAPAAFGRALPVVPLQAAVTAEPGRPDPGNAAATIEAIERAVALTRSGEASGIVTNPISKSVLYAAGFRHPGHTEFLAALAAEPGQPAPRPVMMLWSDALSVVPVTIHIPLSTVPQTLTTDLIVETAEITARDLRDRFGLARPRLAIAGLNPHAGEDGTIGTEDRDIVAPAVERLRAIGHDVSGPLPADTMFHAAARSRYDVALAMYHDQALIPIKTIAFDDGVNATLGLPFVRTSPDHGTAFDIAGTGVARPTSLLAAIRLAGRLTGHARRALAAE